MERLSISKEDRSSREIYCPNGCMIVTDSSVAKAYHIDPSAKPLDELILESVFPAMNIVGQYCVFCGAELMLHIAETPLEGDSTHMVSLIRIPV